MEFFLHASTDKHNRKLYFVIEKGTPALAHQHKGVFLKTRFKQTVCQQNLVFDQTRYF